MTDVAEEAKQMMDAAVVAMVDEQAEEKPAPPKNPEPTVTFVAVRYGWDPRNRHDRLSLWNPHPSRKEAEADCAHAARLGCEPRMIVRVKTTFTIMHDGGLDG